MASPTQLEAAAEDFPAELGRPARLPQMIGLSRRCSPFNCVDTKAVRQHTGSFSADQLTSSQQDSITKRDGPTGTWRDARHSQPCNFKPMLNLHLLHIHSCTYVPHTLLDNDNIPKNTFRTKRISPNGNLKNRRHLSIRTVGLNRKGHFVLEMDAAVHSVLLGCLCSDPQESS